MSNIKLYRGGTPEIKYMWSEKDSPQFKPPFGNTNLLRTPPYDSHADGAYNLGDFVLGMPIRPNFVGMHWQKKLLAEQDIAVGDILQCFWIPADHYATMLNMKIVESDANLAGATVALVTQVLQYNAAGEYTIVDDEFLDTAVKAQVASGANTFDISKPLNVKVSLMKADAGYVQPLYSEPSLPAADAASDPTFGKYYIIGLKVLSLPTDNNITLDQMVNGIYLSLRMQAFECPTNY